MNIATVETIVNLMLSVRKNKYIFYHKDTNQFDYCPVSALEWENLSPDALLPYEDLNNFRLPSYEEIDHKENMRFFVREFVEDKECRRQLFNILRNKEYIDAYMEKLREMNLYDDFIDVCGDVYMQIFIEWADKNNLDFRGK